MQNITNITNALKIRYGPKLVKILNNQAGARALFEKLGKEYLTKAKMLSVDGKSVDYPVHVSRNAGVGAVGESKTLPLAGNQGYAPISITFSYIYGRIQLTAQVVKAAESDKGSFVRPVSSEMQGLKDDLRRELNRITWGNGVGVLCKVNGNQTTPTTVQVKSPGGLDGLDATFGGARYVLEGSYIAFIRNATPTSASDSDIIGVARKVDSVAGDLTSFTLTAAASADVNDGDLVVLAPAGTDATTETSVNREPIGLAGLIDDGTERATIYGLSRTTYPKYKSLVINNAGAAFSIKIAQRLLDLIDQKGGLGGKDECVWMAQHNVVQAYQDVMMVAKRYTNEYSTSPDGGYEQGRPLPLHGYKIEKERMAPYDRLQFINKSGLVRLVNCEGEWADEDGSVLGRVSNKDEYEARFRLFEALQNDHPNKCGIITGISNTKDAVQAD